MATPDPTKIIHAPGELVLTPTDLTDTVAAGGTLLGVVAEIIFRPNLLRRDLTAEEFGSEVLDIVEAGEQAVLAVLLRSFDGDAVSTVFKETSTGSGTGDTGIDYPGTLRAGTLGSARGVKLLFLPDSSDEVPAILLYNAIPLVAETAEVQLEMDSELTIPAIFHAARDGTGRVYQFKKMEDMVL